MAFGFWDALESNLHVSQNINASLLQKAAWKFKSLVSFIYLNILNFYAFLLFPSFILIQHTAGTTIYCQVQETLKVLWNKHWRKLLTMQHWEKSNESVIRRTLQRR